MKRLTIFLIFVGLAGLVMAGLAAFTNMADEWKIGIPAGIAGLGLFAFIPQRTGTTPITGNAAPTPAEQMTLRQAFINIGIALILIALIIGGMVWLYSKLTSWIHDEADKPTTTISDFSPIGHDHQCSTDTTSGTAFRNWLNPGIEYDIFNLQDSQRWKWFFSQDLYYRIRLTGNEQYELATESGKEIRADHAGMLEVKTDYHNNWVEITRCRLAQR